jgi:hypothetical protein
MRAEERPPKKAAITSLNRSSGTGPTSIHTADSDQQSNLNEALQVDPCSVVQTFANIMGGGGRRNQPVLNFNLKLKGAVQ